MSSLTSPVDSSLVRAINELPTTDLAHLAGVHHSPRHHHGHGKHSYSTSSLRARSTSSLLREVGGGSSSLHHHHRRHHRHHSPRHHRHSSVAMSLGQCPSHKVLDPKTGRCIGIHSHTVGHHALKHALTVANAKADGLM